MMWPHAGGRFHRDLVDALSTGDPEQAARAMRQHVRYGLDHILQAISAASAPGKRRSKTHSAKDAAKSVTV